MCKLIMCTCTRTHTCTHACTTHPHTHTHAPHTHTHTHTHAHTHAHAWQVEAAGVNRLDLLQAHGKYPPPPGESEILGVEGGMCT